jgi:(2Fe-2S) ferredoxin
MGDKYLNLSEFNVEGQFLDFVGKAPGKFKHLQLALPSGNVQIKLPKELRVSIGLSLVTGDQIRVFGFSKLNSRTGEIKLKANRVIRISGCPNKQIPPEPKAKILVCQKSGCLKRGSKGLLSELEKTLCDRGLQNQVIIEHTGCLKRCSKAPNCVVELGKFGKKQYTKMHPEAIASLLENNLSG